MNISIIIPLYNKGALVRRAIDSVLTQDFDGELEVVVVDDGSTDDSAAFVKEYADSRVRLIAKPNGGVSSARNKGIEEAGAECFLFLDADDELLPGALQNLTLLHKKYPNTKVLVGGQRYGSGNRIDKVHVCNTKYQFFHIWLNHFYPRPGALIVHRDVIESLGVFDERQSFFEDYEFGLRMLRYGEVAFTNYQMIAYHQDGTGLSSSLHPIEKEMAYYIPEILIKGTTFWERALLYENVEWQIFWWQQQGNEANVRFYQEMQRKHFCRIHKALHWVRQKMTRKGLI